MEKYTPHAVNCIPTISNRPSRNRLLCRLSIFADSYGTAVTIATGEKIIYSGRGAVDEELDRKKIERSGRSAKETFLEKNVEIETETRFFDFDRSPPKTNTFNRGELPTVG